MKWEIKLASNELLHDWKIAGSSLKVKENYIITLHKGEYKGVGELALGSKEVVKLENLNYDLSQVEQACELEQIASFYDFTNILDGIDFINDSLRFAIESAFIDYLHQATDIEKWKIIGTNTIKSVESLCSIPIFSSADEAKSLIGEHPPAYIYKFKISKETISEQIKFFNDFDKAIVLDGNESWGSDVEGFLNDISELDQEKVLFVEQPLDRYALDAYKTLKEKSPVDIYLDESLQSHIHLDNFVELCHGVVIKATKACSHMKMVTQMTNAKKAGLKTVLGCMVESSLGISSLFTVAYGFDYYDLDGFTKLKKDPFNKVFWDKGKVVLSDMN